jgi:hypothetical protein
MRFVLLTLLSLSCSVGFSQESSSPKDSIDSSGIDPSLFDSGFFSDVLDQAKQSDDAMGTQRIVDQRKSRFEPSILFSTNYNYNSNPLAAADNAKVWEDGFVTSFNLGFNLGLGEYPIGDDVLLTPSLYLSHSRTYYDLVKDQGDRNKDFDSDSQVVSVSLPFVLPDDFTLRIAHTYFRPIDFRNEKVDIYINSPSFSLEKQIPLESGGILNISAGAGMSITTGSNYKDTISSQPGIDPATAEFLLQALKQIESVDPSVSRPYNLQDSWNHQLQLSYMHPITQNLLAIPNFRFSRSVYTEGRYTGREDKLTSFGLNFSYTLKEWLNLSAVSNYSSRDTNEIGRNTDIVNYNNFVGGVAFGINYAF